MGNLSTNSDRVSIKIKEYLRIVTKIKETQTDTKERTHQNER